MEDSNPMARWEDMKGDLGLKSKHYRQRLEAIQSVSSHFEDAPFDASVSHESFLRFSVEILDILLFTLALSDSNLEVRISAIESANKIFKRIQKNLPVPELDQYIWGFLATNVDEHKEVQNAAAELFLQKDATLRNLCSKEMIIRLIQRFVTTAMHSLRSVHKKSSVSVLEGFQFTSDIRLLLFSVEGAIHLQLLDISDNANKDNLFPLLIVVASALLEECEMSGDKPRAKEVLQLLRSLGTPHYRCYVISMISSGLYEGAIFVSHYQGSHFMDQETADVFIKLGTMIILKGISITLENSGGLDSSQASEYLSEERMKALQKLVEVLQLPSDLVVPIDEAQDIKTAEQFTRASYLFLRILYSILKVDIVDMKQGDMMQDLILTCAAIASAENDPKSPLSWISKDAQDLANKIVRHLDTYFRDVRELQLQEKEQTRKTKVESCVGIERVVSRMLPNLVPIVKSQLKNDFGERNTTDCKAMSSSVSLASAIIAAHQMLWCLKQVKHPYLSPSSTLLIPCALMALDHHSLHVKRQALKIFMHLKENLNASELRWYKDIILDSVTHNIIGSGELWPLVVQTSIQLVRCLEGSNPRAKWYRSILNEMLGELERNQRNSIWYTVWLHHVGDLFDAMGLVLVAHFRRLLPLLFFWAHTADDSVVLLVLKVFKDVIRNTWPRMPYHVKRFWRELAQLYTDAAGSKSCSALRSSIIEICVLLKTCGGSAFESEYQKEDNRDASLACLKLALDTHLNIIPINT